MTTTQQPPPLATVAWSRQHPYERWIESLKVPVYRSYFAEDVRTLKLGRWDQRGAIADPEFYLTSNYVNNSIYEEDDLFSEAKVMTRPGQERRIWVGNFFPDLLMWDKLDPYRHRGAGGTSVGILFPKSLHASHSHPSHMSVFPSRTYKKAHRHGPGVVIIIPGGEGFSIMWKEGDEKVVVPWHEASVFVPPDRWFHQHFNVGAQGARYLAIHPPTGMPVGADHFDGMEATGEKVLDPARDQIEYPDEDPMVRETFEWELAKQSLTSLMPEEAYKDRNYQWKY